MFAKLTLIVGGYYFPASTDLMKMMTMIAIKSFHFLWMIQNIEDSVTFKANLMKAIT